MSTSDPESSAADIVIAVIGGTGSGKTSFTNRASGENRETKRGMFPSEELPRMTDLFNVGGHRVRLVDTSGWSENNRKEALGTLQKVGGLLSKHNLSLTGIIFTHHMEYSGCFPSVREQWETASQLCGNAPLKSVIISTFCAGKDEKEIMERQESFKKTTAFRQAKDRGATIVRYSDDLESAHHAILTLIQSVGWVRASPVDDMKKWGHDVMNELSDLEGNINKQKEHAERVLNELDERIKSLESDKRRSQSEIQGARALREDMKKLVAEFGVVKERRLKGLRRSFDSIIASLLRLLH